MARLVRLMGHISGDEDTFALLALVLDLARLGDTLAWWRDSKSAWHQAEAARDAAAALRTWHAGHATTSRHHYHRPDRHRATAAAGCCRGPDDQPSAYSAMTTSKGRCRS
jgi:hypothetical protein